MKVEHKNIELELKQDKEGSFVARIATLNVVDKDGDITRPGAFPTNKTILISAYQHGSWAGRLPVGLAVIKEEGDQVLAEGQFNLKSEAGREHYEAVKFTGPLQQWSYGFKVLESEDSEENEKPVRIIKKVDPFEISPVLLGAGIDTALVSIKGDVVTEKDMLRILEEKLAEHKGAISFAKAHPGGTPKLPEETAWDASKEIRAAEVDDLKVMSAFVDSGADPESKSSYKLPHHVASGKHAVVWRATAAAMASLLGARGGVNVPDSAKRGIYNHLVKHYKEFDKEPPEFRAEEMTYADQAETALAAVKDLVDRTSSLAELRRKEGRQISLTNRERLQLFDSSLAEVTASLKELLVAVEPVDKARSLYLRWVQIKNEIREVDDERQGTEHQRVA